MANEQIDREDFINLFLKLEEDFRLSDARIFTSTVFMEYDLLRLQTYEGIKDIKVPEGPLIKIPDKYRAVPFNYLIAKNFFTFYLAPLMERKAIITKNQESKIRKFVIRDGERSLTINKESITELNDSLPVLFKLFSSIGELLLEGFLVTDFVNTQF